LLKTHAPLAPPRLRDVFLYYIYSVNAKRKPAADTADGGFSVMLFGVGFSLGLDVFVAHFLYDVRIVEDFIERIM